MEEHQTSKFVTLCGDLYTLYGRIAGGEACDVYFGHRNDPLRELVSVKVNRDTADNDIIVREWSVLTSLSASDVRGAYHFRRLLPQPIARGPIIGLGSDEFQAISFRWRNGFIHTLDDVMREYPDGVDAETAVWMWKRMLELMGFVHKSGFVHGGVLPRHVLIHARDHGATFAGWSRASHPNQILRIASKDCDSFYPQGIVEGKFPVSRETDLTMIARCVFAALGGDFTTGSIPQHLPEELDEILRESILARHEFSADAWAMLDAVSRAAEHAYGPPRYHPFKMPGW